jgi:acyl dehydratase
MNWFEDVAIGTRTELGSILFTAEAVKRFARAYDPQPFHVDEAAARASHFGGLIASGWHVAACWMKLMVAHLAAEEARALAEGRMPVVLGPSPGFRAMVWAKPVRPGDELAYFTQVVATKPSASRPGWGLVSMLNGAVDAGGATVFSYDGVVFWPRRPGGEIS